MVRSSLQRNRSVRLAAVVALTVGMLVTVAGQSSADVTSVTGSAFGASGTVTLGETKTLPPTPSVTLPAGGGNQTDSALSAGLVFGTIPVFESGPLSVSTQGSTGPGGSVTSSATVANVASGGLTVAEAGSTCTASEPEISGSTTITGGLIVFADPDPAVSGEVGENIVIVPSNPAPNQEYTGPVLGTPDTYRIVFNEQVASANSITVNAIHIYMLGPFATGDVIVGQSACGVVGTSPTTTTSSTSSTTSSTSSSTTSTPPAAPTTVAPASASQVSGGAYGYFVSASIFNNPVETRGPAPTVDLPAGGSATPVTSSLPSADVKIGPAGVFSSDKIDVSTQGTPESGVTSSAAIQNLNALSGAPPTAQALTSTCSATEAGESASATVTGGKLRVSEGADADSAADDTVVDLPVNPAPNTTFEGSIALGDTFRVVLNEQQHVQDAITVNALHMYLLGPTAKGDIIVGQSRCATAAAVLPAALTPASTTAGPATGSGGGASTSGGGQAASGSNSPRRLAATGMDADRLVQLALALMVGGFMLAAAAAERRSSKPLRRR